MKVGIPRETYPGERRLALVPAAAAQLIKNGLQVYLEAGAGVEAGYPDSEYQGRGCQITSSRDQVFAADIVLQVRTPGANPKGASADLAKFRSGQVLVGFANPLTAPDQVRALCATGVTLLAVELVPRISRAQALDALSSQANLAGYRAVFLAGQYLRKVFPMMTTAAGTIHPARVLVLGAGVAGLQAMATSRRLGAVVSAYDVRPAVKEQVQSLGARFLELPLEGAEGQGGYARELSSEQQHRQQELLARAVAEADVVITTAAVPGRRAPLLIPAAVVADMKPGSVIVDLAAEFGGNCELTQADQVVQQRNVTVLGPTNLPSETACHASQMYANNLVKLLQLVLTKEGRLNLDRTDEIVAGCLVCSGGEVVQPQVRQAMGLPALSPSQP
jgi:NAD(P) transhydrogenase subunit alpha